MSNKSHLSPAEVAAMALHTTLVGIAANNQELPPTVVLPMIAHIIGHHLNSIIESSPPDLEFRSGLRKAIHEAFNRGLPNYSLVAERKQ